MEFFDHHTKFAVNSLTTDNPKTKERNELLWPLACRGR